MSLPREQRQLGRGISAESETGLALLRATCSVARMQSLAAQIAVSNAEWKRPGAGAAAEMRRRIFLRQPAVICLTETYRDFLPDGYAP